MRYFCLVAALTAVTSLSGCQSCTQSVSLPIVGDSMSHWACGDQQCSAAVTEPISGGWMTGGSAVGGPSCGCGSPCGPSKYDDIGLAACGSPACNNACSSGACGCGNFFGGGASVGYAPTANPMSMGGGHQFAGCAGNTCNGSCGGKCRIALSRLRTAAEQAKARARVNHPHLAAMVDRSARRCAYGYGGARPGPQQGMATFPYYAVRGPRDFLAANPPSIGP